MGWRFRRTIKILPGVHLNFSKSGLSTTFGPRGAKLTIGHGRIRQTIGLPGTGLSYTESERLPSHPEPVEPSSAGRLGPLLLILLIIIVGIVLAEVIA